MSDFILVLLSLIPIGFMLYVFFDREIDRIRQKRAEAMRRVYLARKAAVERQTHQRL
ncbi:hypothetical protein [Symbiopectobacterium sp. RP]|uniref:hypothetical protein n=1 Tax=Symbiopectobacterium sp. RP TaxID=3248553 RepID=UPI003D285D02